MLWIKILILLKNPIIQWILIILGAFIGYEAWKYNQQNIGADKQIEKQKRAAMRAKEIMDKVKKPNSDKDVLDRMNNGTF